MGLSDDSIEQLKVRYRQCRELISTFREKLSKVLIRFVILQSDNNFLQEHNQCLLQQMKNNHLETEGNKEVNKSRHRSTVTFSAATGVVEETLTSLEKIQLKLTELEKMALLQKTAMEKAKEENFKLKAKLEEAQRNIQQERKKNLQLQGIITSIENKSKRDAISREAAKKRLSVLANEIRDLTRGLSVQKSRSSQMRKSHQVKGSDLSQSFGSTALVPAPVKTSTPYPRSTHPNRMCVDKSVDDTPCKQSSLVVRLQGPLEKEETWNKGEESTSTFASLITIIFICVSIVLMSHNLLRTERMF